MATSFLGRNLIRIAVRDAFARQVVTYSGKLPSSVQARLTAKAFAPEDYRLAFIDAQRLRPAFAFEPKDDTAARMSRFRSFVNRELPRQDVRFEAPRLSRVELDGRGQLTRVTFREGNHRAEAMLRGGMQRIPIAVPPSQYQELEWLGVISAAP